MTFTGTLLPYQNEAVDLMVARKKVLVAYDLGLGKTVLTIAALETLRDDEEIDGPTLVVCLSSLKYQWAKEIGKFSNSNSLVIDGSKGQREKQYTTAAEDFDYVIVNYEQVVNDWEHLSKMSFGALVMDEATAIKGFRSKRSKKVKDLSKKIPVRFALTGTPIENGRPEELYSIMQAIDADVLGKRFDLFDQTFIVRNRFGGVDRYRNLPTLHERLKRASVRKAQTDEDVAPYLPDTIHKDPLYVPLDRSGAVVYRTIADLLQQDLLNVQEMFGSSFSLEAHYGQGRKVGGPEDAMRGAIMSKITALRMLCDHPKLLASSASAYDPYQAVGSKFLHELLEEDERLNGQLLKCKTPKLDVLAEVVEDHISTDINKVVIFCSYVEMASLIRDRVGGVIYTGQMSAREKEAAKVSFQTSPDIQCLISTDAGGYGVDLPQANLLINYDLPWSSGLSVQRNGRIKRASSKWPSIVIQDLLISESIEERQYAMLSQKNAVAAAVVDGKGINQRGGVDMGVGSLVDFLRVNQP
jgi:SNF2 family DNA or RNA helicase